MKKDYDNRILNCIFVFNYKNIKTMAKFKIQTKQSYDTAEEANMHLEVHPNGYEIVELLDQPALESIPEKNQRTIQAITFVLVILIFVGQMTFYFIYLSLIHYKP